MGSLKLVRGFSMTFLPAGDTRAPVDMGKQEAKYEIFNTEEGAYFEVCGEEVSVGLFMEGCRCMSTGKR